ncbi:MAG: FHA domain-containing protein [Myxococcota bacterium]
MQDGQTRKLTRSGDSSAAKTFFDRYRAFLVSVAGTTAGNEYPLERDRVSLGRGPGVDLAFDDSTMSREHAAFELVEGGIRVRDMASTNGVLLNDSATLVAVLKNGDRIQIGEHVFQYVVEERERTPRTYVLPDS